MNVKELIEELNKIENKDLNVEFNDYENGPTEINEVEIKYISELNPSRGRVVILTDC